MMGKTHIAINGAVWTLGVAACQAATGHLQILPATAGTLLVISTSTLADVDSPDSAIGRRCNVLLPGFPAWLADTFGHRRSPFHWGMVPVAVGAVLSLAFWSMLPSLWWVGLAVGAGWWMHIAADCLTWMGAPLWAPFSQRMVRPRYGRRMECNGWLEREVIRFSARALWFCAALWLVTPMIKYVMN